MHPKPQLVRGHWSSPSHSGALGLCGALSGFEAPNSSQWLGYEPLRRRVRAAAGAQAVGRVERGVVPCLARATEGLLWTCLHALAPEPPGLPPDLDPKATSPAGRRPYA